MLNFKMRRSAWLVVMALLAAPLWPASTLAQSERSQIRLPALGESASSDLPVPYEKRLGEQIMREIRRDPDFLDDPVVLDYVQGLWQQLLVAAKARDNIGSDIENAFAWEAFLVRDRSVNAFALPGGYVGVHLGLIAMTGTRDELASVLAHEMSHVTQRHIARSIGNESRQSLVNLAGLVLGTVLAARAGSADATQAVLMGGQAAIIQGQLNFSRDMEREADRVGYGVFETAGFAPSGMAAMFEKLELASRHNDSGNYPYLRSHPLTVERIGEAQLRLDAAPRVRPLSPLQHAVMQGRAKVLMEPTVAAWQRLQGLDKPAPTVQGAERLQGLVASALASNQLRDNARALSAAQAAMALLHQQPSFAQGSEADTECALYWLMAQLALTRGDTLAASQALDSAGHTTSRPSLLLRGQVGLAGAQAQPGTAASSALTEAAQALQTWVSAQPGDAAAWTLLAQCQTLLGQKLRAVRAEAESRWAVGDFSGAMDRLKAGQRMVRTGDPNDFIDASVIDARLHDIAAQRRQLQADARKSGQTHSRDD